MKLWAILLLLALVVAPASASITQVSPNNFSILIGTLQISTIHAFGSGNDYYWMINSSSSPISYWTKVKVERCKKVGASCDWSTTLEELMTSVQSTRVSDTLLFQNYTTDQGSKLNITFKDVGGKLKLSYDINGALTSPIEYQVTFEIHYIPSQINNNSAQKKVTIGNGNSVIYDYSDELVYPAYSSLDTNGKVYRQWFRTGLGGTVKHIDPNLIPGAVVGTSSKSCTALVNGSPCNFSSAFTAISGTFNVTGISIVQGYNDSTKVVYNAIPNSTRDYQLTLNLSNGAGTNNDTWIYGSSIVMAYINATHLTTNLYVTQGNTTEVSFGFLNLTTNSNQQEIVIKLPVNSTGYQIYYGGANRTFNNSLGLSNVFNRTYEDAELGLGNWTTNANSQVSQNATYKKTGNFSVKMTESAVDYFGIYKSVPSCTGKCVFEFYAMSPDATTAAVSFGSTYMIEKTGGAYANSVFIEIFSDAIKYYDSSYHTILTETTTGKWYLMKVTMDTNANTFNLDVDGIRKVTNGGVRGTVNTISAIGMSSESTAVHSFMDSVKQKANLVSPEPAWGTWSSEQSVLTQTSVWVIPQNHPQSEIKTCSTDYCSGNITLTPGNQVQNHTIWGNWTGTASVILTYQGYFNATNVTEYTTGGYYYYNTSVQPATDISNAMLTFPILDSNFINSPEKGSISVSTNDSNATTTSFNTTYIKQNSSYLSAGIYKYFNFTIPYNYPPVVSASNQAYEFANPMNVAFSATDTESNALNNSLTINSVTKYGSSPINFNGLAIGNYVAYLNTTDFNGTVGGAYTWTNITFWVNVTADVTPPAAPVISNGTAGMTTIPLISTNSSETGGWYLWEMKVNGTSSWTYIGNTTTNTTTATALTSGQIYDLRLRVNDSSNNLSPYSNTITVQTLTSDPAYAVIIQKLADIQAKQIEQDATIANAGVVGFIGGLIGGAMVIGVLRRKR